MSRTRLLLSSALVAAIAFTPLSGASASKTLSGEVCTFESNSAIYGGGPPETIKLTWTLKTGEIKSFHWDHGGVPWYSFAANPGTVVPDSPVGSYYMTNIGLTTAGYDSTRYQLKGYLAIDMNWPNATFAAIYEGTGTAWMAAKGTVTCK